MRLMRPMVRHQLIKDLWREHGRALQAFFRRRSSSSRDATDLTQEVYLRLLRAADEREIANPEAYLFTVARNLLTEHAVSEQRQAKGIATRHALGAEPPFFEADLDREIDQRAQLKRLRQIVTKLPEPQRATILMAYRDDMSYAEIAKQLDVHRSMVGKYMIQALNACRRSLKSEDAP